MSSTLRLIPLPPKPHTPKLGIPRRPSSCGAHPSPMPPVLPLPLLPIEVEVEMEEAVDASQEAPQKVIVAPEPRTIEERQQQLARRLEEVRAQNARLGIEEKRLESEIVSVKENLEIGRRRLPLAKMVIASPCDVPWGQMVGDDRKRFCKSCALDVHNLSAMTQTEVEAFLEANADGKACVRLFERTDGTILTADCPVGMKRRRTRALLLATMGAGACALFGFTAIAVVMFGVLEARTPPPPPRERVVFVEVPGPKVFVPAETTPAPVVPPGFAKLPSAPNGMGWVLIDAPEGTKVYEGKRLIGTGPTVVTLTAGSHVLRAEGGSSEHGPSSKWSQSHDVNVIDHDKTDVLFRPSNGSVTAGRMPCPAPGFQNKFF